MWLRSSVQNVICRWAWCTECSAHHQPKACWKRCRQYSPKSSTTTYSSEGQQRRLAQAGDQGFPASAARCRDRPAKRVHPRLRLGQQQEGQQRQHAQPGDGGVEDVGADGAAVRHRLHRPPGLERAGTLPRGGHGQRARQARNPASRRDRPARSISPRHTARAARRRRTARRAAHSQAIHDRARSPDALLPAAGWRSRSRAPAARRQGGQHAGEGSLRERTPQCSSSTSPRRGCGAAARQQGGVRMSLRQAVRRRGSWPASSPWWRKPHASAIARIGVGCRPAPARGRTTASGTRRAAGRWGREFAAQRRLVSTSAPSPRRRQA